MIAYEKGVVRRDRALVEDAERRLQLRGTTGLTDHGALLRVIHQRSLAIVERQCHGFERERSCRSETRCQRGHAGALHQLPPVEHFETSSQAFSVSQSVARIRTA